VIILGIETSCDETGCGLVDENFRVLGQCLYSQAQTHARFGGVVPEVAARAHLEKIGPVVRAALEEARLSLESVDAIAYTRGPGLLGPLLVGAAFAQGLARSLNKPALGLNHLEGHLASAYLTHPELEPPFLALLVSGGHTELVHAGPNLEFRVLGQTRDDAAGEAFDKCGKLLGLDYPAGAEVGGLAERGRRDFLTLPRALMDRGNLEFSFSGLKTAMMREAGKRNPETLRRERADFCASLENAIVDVLSAKALWALEACGESRLVVAGGVAANNHLRQRLTDLAGREGFQLILPDREFCGDNGVMMAAAAQKRMQLGKPLPSGNVQAGLRWEE
jgi:N6-L-threonylcarbamoyladenine synthase